MQLSLSWIDCILYRLLFTHQSTGMEPGLWNINTKVEGSEFSGVALKLKSDMALVKMEGDLLRLEVGGEDKVMHKPHPDNVNTGYIYF